MQQPRGLGGPAANGQTGPQAPQAGPEQGAPSPGGGPEPASPEEQAMYNRFVALFMLALYDEKTVEQVELDKKGLTRKSLTDAWAVPRQIPEGPHAGKWYVPVPADLALREQRDPKTGEVKDDIAPAWKNPEIVERDPAWFPSEEL